MKAVFLDRDGVLNQSVIRGGKPYPPDSVSEMKLVPGAPQAMDRLKKSGYLLLVVTNQPDIGRGTQTPEAMDSIHNALREALPLDEFFVCTHARDGECVCRKPKPGLLLQGIGKYSLRADECFMIGDRWRDMDAAAAAGVPGIWIDYGYREQAPSSPPVATVKSLGEAVDFILNREVVR